jgi:hypothetical protein
MVQLATCSRTPRSSIAIPTCDSLRPSGDHAARRVATLPQPWADLTRVLELPKRTNAMINDSGACKLPAVPGTGSLPRHFGLLARVFDAWGFDCSLWGTDRTSAFAVVNYAQAVEPS